MKRVGLWAIGIGLCITVGLITVKQGYAEKAEHAPTCTKATLKGTYMFAQSGYVITAQGSVPNAVTGKDIFDGNGAFDSLATISTNGDILTDVAAAGTYTVNVDCTGTVTIPSINVHLDIFVAPNGNEFYTIETDKGSVLAGTIRRVSP